MPPAGHPPRPPSPAGSATGSPAPPSPTASSVTPSPAPSSGGAPLADLLHGPRSRPAVALTFHGAGDPALTTRALRIAAEHHAGLTVLAVGSWLADNRRLATAILDGGHDLGNHTWSHLPMRQLSSAQAHREVARAADLLTSLTGSAGSWFRPSGTPRSTATIRRAAAASGYDRCLAYDVDPLGLHRPRCGAGAGQRPRRRSARALSSACTWATRAPSRRCPPSWTTWPGAASRPSPSPTC